MTASNLFFIDASLPDYQQLIDSLPAGSDWVLIQPDQDGLEQMLAALQDYSTLQSIQMLGHSRDASLLLGSTLLSADNLGSYAAALGQIGSYLAEDGDLLLYGCNLAASAEGQAFIEALAGLTGADVAASDDLTGFGGDWQLEVQTGDIEAQALEAAGYAASLLLFEGSDANDTLSDYSSNDTLYGYAGNDSLTGSSGNDSLYGGSGNDILADSADSNLLDGGDGDDLLEVSALTGRQTLIGGNGSDFLNARGQTMYLSGGEGHDTLQAAGYRPEFSTDYVQMASATLDGGNGNNRLTGEWLGSAVLTGGDDIDILVVSDSYQATLSGGLSDDILQVAFDTSNASLIGAGMDARYVLDGGSGNDLIQVSGKANRYDGLVSATLSGGDGNDAISLTESSTSVTNSNTGGVYQASLDGGSGNDTLTASGVLALTLTGGSGSDTFELTAQQYETLARGSRTFNISLFDTTVLTPQTTVITDFQAGIGGDVLDLNDLLDKVASGYDGSNPFDGGYLVLQLVQDSNDTLLMFDPDGTTADLATPVAIAVLQGVDASTLTLNNFNPGFEPQVNLYEGLELIGTPVADTLIGGLGNDTLWGRESNDVLDGSTGADRLYGEGGDDELSGSYGNDTLDGGDGNDILYDNSGSNVLLGGAGNDSLTVRHLSGNQSLSGEAGDDQLAASGQNVTLDGGDDSDSLTATGLLITNNSASYVKDGTATLLGGLGNDTLNASYWATASLQGHDGDDLIVLDNIADATVEGGSGIDTINASIDTSSNSLYTSNDGTYLYLDGGADNDDIYLDVEAAGDGGLLSATLVGGSGRDWITATEHLNASDSATGGIYQLSIDGGLDNDRIWVYGSLNTTITGGAGSDRIIISSQQYQLLKAGSRDFVTTAGTVSVSPEATIITDFTPGDGGDVLDVSELLDSHTSGWLSGENAFDSGHLRLMQYGNDVHVQLDEDASGSASGWLTFVVLLNTSIADFTSANFLPAAGMTLVDEPTTGGVSIDGNAVQGQVLSAVSTLADDNGMGPLSYQWFADGVAIAGAMGSTLALGQTLVNAAISVQISFTDGIGNRVETLSAETSAVANINDAPGGQVLIYGTPAQGNTLSSAVEITDADGMPGSETFLYQWYAGNTAIDGATSSSLTLTQAEVGQLISLRVTYTDGFGAVETVSSSATEAVGDVQFAPTGVVSITSSDGTGNQGQTLTASNTLDDADGIASAISYQWQADGIDIDGATGETLYLSQALTGKEITVVASYTDGDGNLESVSSTGLAVNDIDMPTTGTVSITINSSLAQGQTLSASNDLADEDGIQGLISYQWQLDGVDLAGATGSSLYLTQAMVGAAISVVASYTDGDGNAVSVSSSATGPVAEANIAPGGSLTIEGTATQGQTLTLVDALVDEDGMGSVSYQWLADGVAIEGAVGSELLLTQALVGAVISVEASWIDGDGQPEAVSSAPTTAVSNTQFAPTGSVSISGTPVQGETLSASNDLADLDGLGEISYQWYANGAPIAGATSDQLYLDQQLVGSVISVTASYTDGDGSDTSVPSAGTDSVANVQFAPQGSLLISGTAAQGQSLTLQSTLSDLDGINGDISYQWYADGVEIAGANGLSLLLDQALVGAQITVSASWLDGDDVTELVTSAPTAAVANVQFAPTGSLLITGTAAQGQTLTLSDSLTDADGMSGYGYQWYADGVAIEGATGSSLYLEAALVGSVISVTASWTDGDGLLEEVASAATPAVADINMAPTGSVSISGLLEQGQTLTASNDLADEDGIPDGLISYQWQADGVDIAGATGSSLTLTQQQVGASISVVASYTDGDGNVTHVSSAPSEAVANQQFAPTGSLLIEGTAEQGQTLTLNDSLADADGMTGYAYQWYADGVAIEGATDSSLSLTQAQVGAVITVSASWTDGDGNAESVGSEPTLAVGNVQFAPTGSLLIEGNAVQGQTLTLNDSLADADGMTGYAYQWYADGVAIEGATGSSLLLEQALVNSVITVTASWTDGDGMAESISSAPTSAVAEANLAPTGSVTLSGTAEQGQTLNASNDLADADGIATAISYQWQADGVDIEGATGSSLLLDQSLVDAVITVVASYTDGDGNLTRISSAPSEAVANQQFAPTGSLLIEGTAEQGQTLTLNDSLADADGMTGYAYQWYADGVAIEGATGSSLLLDQALVNSVITVTASWTDGDGVAESITSDPTSSVTNLQFAPTGSLTIEGNTTLGETLTLVDALQDADGKGSVSYQWYADGVEIADATGSSLLLDEALTGSRISVSASWTDGDSQLEQVTSAETSPVSGLNTSPTGSVSISGTAEQGQTLTASNDLADADGISASISYQWQADGVDIAGATGSTLYLSQALVGAQISVVASYTDDGGFNEAVSSTQTSAVANLQFAHSGELVIDGTAAQGQTLSLLDSLVDEDGMTGYAYQWYADGVAIEGATGSSLYLSQALVDAVITASASWVDGDGVAESALSAPTASVQNQQFSPGGSVSISGTPAQGQTLSASNSLSDEDGISSAISYQWLADGVAIEGATGDSLLLTQQLVGAQISVVASYTDGDGQLESVASSATLAIDDVQSAPTGSVSISGTLEQGQTLSASNSLADADGIASAISYQWLADGVAIEGATADSLYLTQQLVGAQISVIASYTDGDGQLESVESAATSSVQNVQLAPSGSVSISGTPEEGQTLSASNDLADEDGLGAISYQWYADGVAIDGAVSDSLLLDEALVGSQISVVASYTDGDGQLESVESAATAAVANLNDAPTGSLSIEGTAEQGQTLTLLDTLDDPDGLGSVSYQWLADGVAIEGATGSSLYLSQALVGAQISVVASWTDLHGSNEQVESSPTALVADVLNAPTGSVTINGTPEQGQTLTASNDLADEDGLGSISYQWQADGVDIDGATGSSLYLSQALVGASISVIASYTDGGGTQESVSSDSTTSVLNTQLAPTGSVSISGTLEQGQTLNASNDLADEDGLGAISYQWYADGIAITGANSDSLYLGQELVGAQISVIASYTDGEGASESVESSPTAAVADGQIAPTGSVSISGLAEQGQILSASNDLADQDGLGTISYQWYADGVAIAGASSDSLLLSQEQVGKSITVIASYTDGDGALESVASSATALVANLNDAPSGSLSIEGSAAQGQTLTLIDTLDDLDGMGSVSYQWLADGVAIEGATGDSLYLTQELVGASISVSASWTDGYGQAESVTSSASSPVANVSFAPVGSVSISGNAAQGQTLTASNDLSDEDGLGSISYQWYADGVAIDGATGDSLLLSQEQVGKSITVIASYTDGDGSAEAVQSAATAAVANLSFAPTGSVSISGNAEQGQELVASNDLADQDGLGTISYQWYADGVAIAGASSDRLLLSQEQVGKSITVIASYTDGDGALESVASSATALVANLNDAPTGSLSIEGSAAQGQTLTLIDTLDDLDGMGSVSYQWLADGVAIEGATGDSLYLTQELVGASISVSASWTDGYGQAESVTSSASSPVANVSFAPVGSVSISGNAAQGQTLTASNDLSDEDGLGSISYQWYADGVAIEGAAGDSLYLTQDLVGASISVIASYTDDDGSAEAVQSAATAAVANLSFAPTGSVSISGNAEQGQQLVASNDLADEDGLGSISYQWYADGVAIAGASSDRLLLSQEQVGKSITVIASYTDGDGALESVASSATALVANRNDAPTGSLSIEGNAAQGQTLTLVDTLDDLDGMGSVSYQWLADGEAIEGATGDSLYLTQELVGASISVSASWTDGGATQESVSSDSTASVLNAQLAPTGSVSISGSAAQGQTLTASNDLSDEDGLGSISYQWYADGVAIEGAAGDSLYLTQDLVGASISVIASYTDGDGNAEAVQSAATATVANLSFAPTGSVSISGNAEQGQELVASNDLADEDGLGSISYQWYADGVAIAGASSDRLLLSQEQVGKSITVIASYTDGDGALESVASSATAAVANRNDAPSGSLSIAGIAEQGQTLTLVDTLDDLDGMGQVSYQWLADGVAIDGATGSSLLLDSSLIGAQISVQASWTDGYGTQENITSAATVAVIDLNDAPVGSVSISGTAIAGEILTASNDLTDGDGMGEVSYQWYADGSAITGATGDSLLITDNLNGLDVYVVASYTDAAGNAESVASGTVTIEDTNDAPVGSVLINGSAVQGQTLTASNDLSDADGIVGEISYQWYADGRAITHANSASLLLDYSHVGKVITVTASYTDGLGNLESVTSAGTAPIPSGTNPDVTATLTPDSDIFNGGTGDDLVFGLDGNDSLSGGGGNNTLDGGLGNDFLMGWNGSNSLLGGAGNDTYYVDGDDLVFEEIDAGYDRVYSLVSYTLTDNVEALELGTTNALDGYGNALANVIIGNGAANYLSGNGGDDSLAGGNGNDTLDGGTGNDTMAGGNGDDIYYVDSSLDVINEQAGMGNDTVYSSASYSASAHIETIWLVGSNASNLVGNEQDNTLHGNELDNRLNGGAGIDVMYGGLGDDIYYTDSRNDAVVENAGEGYDQINTTITYVLSSNVEALLLQGSEAINGYGNELDNKLYGNSGNNRLDGRGGIDIMYGGAGNDIYYVDDSLDRTVETADNGYDLVYASVTHALNQNVETLVLKGSAELRGFGNALDNKLYGNSASNVLNGKAGADWMYGDDGDDIYYIDNTGDRVIEFANKGTDYVISTVTFALSDNVEVLTLRGSDAIKGYGSAQDNKLYGNAASNVLNGMEGADAMYGGAGDDVYFVDNAADRVIELAGEGSDIINSSVTYTLSSHVETLVLKSTSSINGYGNELDNRLYGNSGHNILQGANGDDSLNGGLGNDTLSGGQGRDILTGDAGRDVFVFSNLTESGLSADSRDVITDFSSGSDRIDLSAIDANSALAGDQAFQLLGNGQSFSSAGQLMLVNGVLYGNTDADSAAEFSIKLSGVSSLSSADFIL